MKSSGVCIKTRSPPASLPILGQATKHTIVKWPIRIKQNTVFFLKICFEVFIKYLSPKILQWINFPGHEELQKNLKNSLAPNQFGALFLILGFHCHAIEKKKSKPFHEWSQEIDMV